ncbi:MAG: chemotaxis protein CheB [Candidatus Sulfopaludibacter sp.]|nr:chemotaxis protein CheB [Candidatus Sulfopaludibacter sp.]
MKKTKPAATPKRPVPVRASPGPTPAGAVPQDNNECCPIVGFGASAGGLDAFTSLLQEMPADPGLALVLVQHLDPQHSSILTELLARATPMRVTQVVHETKVKPNHVYVIPPNKDLLISGCALRLEPRSAAVPHMPIDRFFRSLAADQAEKAIAVVLSGTASDGSQGVKAIKAGGGITFAQEPSSAQYDGMPRSAIATGCIDSVLPVPEIARELLRLRQHPYLREEPKPQDEAETESDSRHQREIFNVLRNATGVDFSLYKPGTIQRRTQRRMALLKMENLGQYADFIRQHPDELSALFQDILINVTSFFRETATFDAIRTQVLPVIFKDRGTTDPLRIWVPGCATGEEAYSIAICVCEYLKEAGSIVPIQVFGTDLSEWALEKARAGIYPETIAADVSPQRLRRFFVRANSSYQIARTIRDTCIFARQNLTKDPPFSKCDLILCRNVLIYLGHPLQSTAMRLFHYALQPHGYLILGLSESIGNATNLFEPTDKKLKIYSRRPANPQLGGDLGPYQDSRHHEPRREPPPAHVLLNTHHKVDQMLLARYSPAALVVDPALRIVEFRGHTAPYVEHAAGEATLDLTRMAPGGLAVEVQRLVRKAHGKNSQVKGAVSVAMGEHIRALDVTVIPIQTEHAASEQFLVIIEEQVRSAPVEKKKGAIKLPASSAAWAQRVKEMEQELAATREYLQTVIEEQEAATEELKSAHEEVQSGNEELQSTNEELLTAKEELQSTNEELTTVNEEMQGRNTELQQINNDLLNLLSSVNIPILMLGGDLRIRRFTPQAEKLFNLLATDVGRPVSDLRLKINVPDVVALSQEVLDDLRPREREVQDTDGRSYSMWVRPYRTTENRIEGVLLALLDITERKQTAEARYRRLFEAAADGILIADASSGEILDVNPFLLRLAGYTRSRIIGAKLWESPLFQGTGIDEKAIRQLGETESLRKTVPLLAESGQTIETEILCNLYSEGERKVIQFGIRDISARKRMEAQFRTQAQQAQQGQQLETVGRLAGGIAHDFGNLLTSLLGHCELLEKELGGAGADGAHLREIRSAAERAAQLTRQLVAFGRKQAVQPAVLDLNDVIRGIQQPLLSMLNKDVHLDVRLQAREALVKADRSELEQVVLNLALNGRDAMTEGGRLVVQTGALSLPEAHGDGASAIPAGDYVTLTVKDTGAGMDPEPFFTAKGSGEGAGLGLAASYGTVRKSGGYVVATSTLGAGTTFTVYLPAAVREEAEASPPAPVRGGVETILLVDDEPAVRQVTAQYLSGLGYRVLEAAGGREGIRAAKEHEGSIELLLADVVSGREVAFQLAPPRPAMKVVYMSGHNEDTIAHHGVPSDGDAFLQKPFRLPELGARVRAILDRRKS